jgi:hypothetical protein
LLRPLLDNCVRSYRALACLVMEIHWYHFRLSFTGADTHDPSQEPTVAAAPQAYVVF